jgi:hypothetical protein
MKKYFTVGFVMLHIMTVNIFIHNSFAKQFTLEHGETFTHHHGQYHHHIHDSLDHQNGHNHTLVFTDFYSDNTFIDEVIVITENTYYSFQEQHPDSISKALLRPPIV